MSSAHRGDSDEPRPAGPVPGSGPSSSQAAGEDPNPAPPAGGGPAGDGAAEVEHDFDALLAKAEDERDEYLELAKRTKADFENFRKRMTAEVQAAAGRGRGEMARELIDAVDNLERALETAEESADGLADGVGMVLRGMREALSRNGIEAVDPRGEQFDPNQHEALSTAPSEEVGSGNVIEVVQKGYRMGDQVIRPARVVVSA